MSMNERKKGSMKKEGISNRAMEMSQGKYYSSSESPWYEHGVYALGKFRSPKW